MTSNFKNIIIGIISHSEKGDGIISRANYLGIQYCYVGNNQKDKILYEWIEKEKIELNDPKIEVKIDKKGKKLHIIDEGIGMSAEEIEKYINEVAFSGAEEFVKKMEEAGSESNNDIIGKFGLGFYSAFMVASKVEVESLSMNEGSKPTKWICEGETTYTFEESNKEEVGTKITLFIDEENKDFLNKWKLNETLKNHCDFMPYEIYLWDANEKVKPTKEDGSVDNDAPEVAAEPMLINETNPIWKRDPKELLDEVLEDYINQASLMNDKELSYDRSEWMKTIGREKYDDEELEKHSQIHTVSIELEQIRRFGGIVYDYEE